MRRRLSGILVASALTGASLLGVGTAQAAPEPQAVVAACASITDGAPIIVPNDFTPALSDTRSAGHYELSGTALHVYTDNATGQAKVAEYVAIPATPLSLAGEPSLTWSGSATPPGMQLVVDLENDGTPDGIIVGEPAFYGDRWWASNALISHIGATVPPAVVSPGGDGSLVAGTLSDWLSSYPNAQVVAVGFSLGSGVLGDGSIASLTFGCIQRSFAAPAPTTPIDFDQTKLFGSTVAGAGASASWSLTSGPNGQSVSIGNVVIAVDNATAAELSSCTVSVNGGPATPVVIAYNPMVDGSPYIGAVIYDASDLVIETGTSLTIAVACQTTAGATIGAYPVTAKFTYCNENVHTDAVVSVQPCTVGTLADVLTIIAVPVVTTPPTVTPVATPTPSSSAVLAATGPAQASSGLLLGLIALFGGMALVGIGAIRRTGSTRQH